MTTPTPQTLDDAIALSVHAIDKRRKAWGAEDGGQAVEESAELIVEIMHFNRGRSDQDKVMDELADVFLTCLGLADSLTGGIDRFAGHLHYKAARLQQRAEREIARHNARLLRGDSL